METFPLNPLNFSKFTHGLCITVIIIDTTSAKSPMVLFSTWQVLGNCSTEPPTTFFSSPPAPILSPLNCLQAPLLCDGVHAIELWLALPQMLMDCNYQILVLSAAHTHSKQGEGGTEGSAGCQQLGDSLAGESPAASWLTATEDCSINGTAWLRKQVA